MSELDQEALRVLELAREARTPTGDDRARVRERLTLAGVAAPPAAAGTTDVATDSAEVAAQGAGSAGSAAGVGGKWLGSAASTWILGTVCAASAMVGGLAGVATMDVQPPPKPGPVPAAAPVITPPEPAPQPPAEPEVEPAATPEPEMESKPAAARPGRKPARPADGLGQELKLLHRARAAWRRGEAGDALSLLQRHRARYPRSAVAAERDALRVLCLCDLGREAQARRLGRRWLRDAPHSPLRSAVKGSCAFE